MIYDLIRFIVLIFIRIVFGLRVRGLENIPASGGVIVAANHVSLWDPPVIGCALNRKINFMAKEELFANPAFGWLIRKLKAFPVRRGAADRNAIRTAIQLVENGEVLGLFPEGTRSKTGELGNPEAGVGMIALKTGAVIIPAAIIGTNKVFQEGALLPRFEVIFGNPLPLPTGRADRETVERLGEDIMAAIDRLLKEA